MEWNGRFQKWNGRQSSILPYQFHTRFRVVFTEKYMPMLGSDKKYCHRSRLFNFDIYAYYLSTNRGTLVVYIAQTE